ncbi:MAG: hypothetical protein ABSG93_17000 [Solirubrobacteraceae bacterium]|jgi:hypothetical protein
MAVGVLVAAAAAILSVYRVDGSTLKARSLQYSSATTQALVDSPTSVLGDLSQSFEPLSARATVYANFMASPAVLALIGQQVGLSGEQLYATGPVSASQPRVVQEPTALKRNTEITGETDPYRLSFESQPNLPTINVYAQAPTTALAVGLANGAVVGLKQYITALEAADKTPARARVTIRQLGPANGAVVDGGISKELAILVFVGVFLLWCILLLAASRFREVWRGSALLQDWDEHSSDEDGHRGKLGDDASEAPLNGHGDSETHLLGTPSRQEDDDPAMPVRSLL